MNALKRVAITGVGLTTPLGNSFSQFMNSLYEAKTAIKNYEHLKEFGCLKTKLAALLENFNEDKILTRQMRRSMSRVSLLAVDSTAKAINDCNINEHVLHNANTGVAFGSTMGGTSTLEDCFQKYFTNKNFNGMLSSTFLRIMPHTCAANIALAFGITGRAIATSTACASSTQAIGFGFESIQNGLAKTMICGGAEEFHISIPAVFDVMFATSTNFNSTPELSPKPFDENRDGIVVGEASATVILEEWEQAIARGAKIYAEIVSFHTNTDAGHMTNPSTIGMTTVMSEALEKGNIKAENISYINAHGTGTIIGDIAESQAIYNLFKNKVPVSSLKGHLGHLMGACGVVETIACLGMLNSNVLIPTKNLINPDPKCGALDYIKLKPRVSEQLFILKNSFAFGGVNATLVIKKV